AQRAAQLADVSNKGSSARHAPDAGARRRPHWHAGIEIDFENLAGLRQRIEVRDDAARGRLDDVTGVTNVDVVAIAAELQPTFAALARARLRKRALERYVLDRLGCHGGQAGGVEHVHPGIRLV